jgi:acetyltransferase
MTDLFSSLSPISVYYRFFSRLKTLPYSMLARFTQVDYDREIALVALDTTGTDEKMLGVARVIMETNQRDAEFAVPIADDQHRKGTGAELLRCCLAIAKQGNIQKVWGMVLQENSGMLALGRKLGFTIKRIPEDRIFELTIDLGDQKNSSATKSMKGVSK